MSNGYVTPEEAAEQFNVTPKTVRSWLRSGELVGIKVGKSWRIHQNDLNRYLDGQRLVVLMVRARQKQPDIEWSEGRCKECGTVMPVPDKPSRNWVCSSGCKVDYDAKAEAILGFGTEEYANCVSTVVPYF